MSKKVSDKNNKIGGGQIRIIAGKLKGRKLGVPIKEGLRPTSDRVRETLFNWLQLDIKGSICLDLFAGTGALGIEAISRGAKKVSFVEFDAGVYGHLLQLLNNDLNFSSEVYDSFHDDAISWLGKHDLNVYDMVFIDPPYKSKSLVSICEKLQGSAYSGLIYLEDDEDFREVLAPFTDFINYSRAGAVHFGLVRLKL